MRVRAWQLKQCLVLSAHLHCSLVFGHLHSSLAVSFWSQHNCSKQCDLVPSRVFCIVSFRPAQNACWELPKPFPNCIQWMQACAFLRNASILRISKKSTPKADAKSTFGVFRLPALLPVRLQCLICEESLDIFLCPQKPLHLLPGFAVFQIDLLLLLEQFSVLGVQIRSPWATF